MTVKGKASSRARLRASDIKDVEAGLENVRREQIVLGGVPLSERPAEQIFFLDQTGIVDKVDRRKLSERGLLAKRPLRIDEILRPASQVPPQKQPGAAAGGGGERRLLERKVREIKRAASAGSGEDKAKNKAQGTKNVIQDIWAGEDGVPASSIKQRKTASKGSDAARLPLSLPLPGTSYRPNSEDLEALRGKIIKARAKKSKRRCRVRKQLPPPALLTGHAGTSAMELAVREILSGTPIQEDLESADQDEGNEKEGDVLQEQQEDSESKRERQDRPLKKTKRERRKEAMLKERLAKKLQLEQEKRMMRQLDSLKAISRQVRQELDIRAQQKGEKIGSSAMAGKRADKSRLRAEEKASLALTLPKEVPTSMRTVRMGCNLVREQFRSLQHRGLVDRCGKSVGVKKGGSRRRVKTKFLARR